MARFDNGGVAAGKVVILAVAGAFEAGKNRIKELQNQIFAFLR